MKTFEEYADSFGLFRMGEEVCDEAEKAWNHQQQKIDELKVFIRTIVIFDNSMDKKTKKAIFEILNEGKE